MKRLLIQTQLSNYDTNGKFILECDSGWQMVMGRVRELLRLDPQLEIDVMGPIAALDFHDSQVITQPSDVNPDLDWHYLYGYRNPEVEQRGRLNYVQHTILPNALATRYDFNFDIVSKTLGLHKHKQLPQYKYDAVYINDPMLLRNFKAMFHMAGYQPKFFVHSHFIDNPTCPKFPKDASLWLGQCEAAIKADFNFWQCESAMKIFFNEMRDYFTAPVVAATQQKSMPWDDGYSDSEMASPINKKNLRFNPEALDKQLEGKIVLFVPNRIGGRGRSSDYTNCGKFMFDMLPKLRQMRQDFVVIAGNPSQKFLNSELVTECGRSGYISIVPDALNRDEFKHVVNRAHIAVGLYDQDSYGGTAARECISLGCMPLWIDNFEYSSLAREAGIDRWLAKADFSDLPEAASRLMDHVQRARYSDELSAIARVVRARCSYESTTKQAFEVMKRM